MPEPASDPDLRGTGKEGGESRHRGHRIGGFAVDQSGCYWGSFSLPPHHRLMNEVIVGVGGGWFKVPQEHRCSWGAPSFRVTGVLESIGFLGVEKGGHGGRGGVGRNQMAIPRVRNVACFV